MGAFVSTTFLPNDSSVFEAIELLVQSNIKTIELGSNHRCELNIRQKLANYKDCKFLTHNFFPPEGRDLVINLGSRNPDILEKSLNFVKAAIDFSEEIGAEIYTVHPGFVFDPVSESNSVSNYDFQFTMQKSEDFKIAHQQCWELFMSSIDRLREYLQNKKVKLAIETQGSVEKAEYVIFSKPDEIEKFIHRFSSDQIGINLNFGHLNLASRAFEFDKAGFVRSIMPSIFAVELSHNEGLKDDHQALKENAWYMKSLSDPFFSRIPIIFEARFISIQEVIKSFDMICRLWN